jgi:hypothetical protein
MKDSAQKILAQAYERELKQRIGDGLRRTYDSTLRERLPSDWLKLLDKIKTARSSGR